MADSAKFCGRLFPVLLKPGTSAVHDMPVRYLHFILGILTGGVVAGHVSGTSRR